MASPEIESHARAMLANRLVAVRRLDEALKSVDEATQALRDARARARSEYVAARRAGWSTYELNRLGLSRDRARRVPRRDSSSDAADAAGAIGTAGSAPADLPSRTAPREAAAMTPPDRVPATTGGGFRDVAAQPMTDLFRPRSRPSEDAERRPAASPLAPPHASPPAPPPASSRTPAADPRKDTDEADTASVAIPASLATNGSAPSGTPASPVESRGDSIGDTADDASNDSRDDARDDANGTPSDGTTGDRSEETLERGDWYVDTQSARTTAMSAIPSPGLATASAASTAEKPSG